MRDFTLEKYKELLKGLKEYHSVHFSHYFKNKQEKAIVLLRHDVDRLAQNALAMAQLEKKMGIKATYYFRTCGKVFNPKIIKQIASLGHEIGFHYESLDQAKGDKKEAIKYFERDLVNLRKYYPVKTVCMHGNPLTKFDNRDLWQKYSYKKYGILGEAYLDLEDMAYLSDTGRTWNNKFKVKDHLVKVTKYQIQNIDSTDDLIKHLKNKKYRQICLLVHPERWDDSYSMWLSYLIFDNLVRIFKSLRRKSG